MVCPASPEPAEAAFKAMFVIAGTAMAVRDGLCEILRHPVMAHQTDELRGDVEVVLAEALNNVVEHAYCQSDGQIELFVRIVSGRLLCDIFDTGAAMPNGDLPPGLAIPITPDDDLPEGGFGWLLIRSLTQNLRYSRIDARNHLSFNLNIEHSSGNEAAIVSCQVE